MSMLDVQAVSAAIRSRGLPIGEPLKFSQQTLSTNADAVEAAKAGTPHGALFITDWQTAGRGRLGRTWLSPARENLMFSLVLRPSIPAVQLAPITLALGLGVADAVAQYVGQSRVGIKWPNDVYIDSKKVSGILVEGAVLQQACEYVVVGIGINVAQRQFDDSIAGHATSIALETDEVPSRTDVLVAVLTHLSERLEDFRAGGLACMLKDLHKRDVTRGRTVRLDDDEGVAEGIDLDGTLRVRVKDEVRSLHAGDVTILM